MEHKVLGWGSRQELTYVALFSSSLEFWGIVHYENHT